MDYDNLFERIQLSFSLDNCLKGPTYQVEFFLKDYDKFDTETVKINNQTDSSHIDFTKAFKCDYHFSKIQFFTVNVIRRKDRQKMINFKAIDEDDRLTLSSIVACKDSVFTCPIRKNAPNSEKLIIKAENPNYLNMKSKNIYTYFDFIKHGIKLKCYIGIDFTKGSDHILKKEENQYLQAIAGFRETLFSFVRDFKVFGYGAKINETNEKPGFFKMNFNDKDLLHGYTEIEKSYKECLKKISFCEEDYLSPLIENIKNLISKNYELNIYNIFFLLISNPPVKEDYQKCIDLFISNTFLPLSVIVVGIGDKEFKEIKHLISKNRKCSSEGIERARNNVYFVSMKDCNYNNEILKNKCLKEIPKQVVEFYKINKTSPDDVKEKKLENINKSIEKSLNIINAQNNNKVIINNDNIKDNVVPKTSKVLNLKENYKQNTNNNEIKDSKDDSDNNFNLFKDSDKALNNKIRINNNNNDNIINDNLNKNKIDQNTKHKNKKKERVNEIQLDSDIFSNDLNNISPNDILLKESNFVNRTPQNTEDEKQNQINKLENPFRKENKKYRETPNDFQKNEIKKIENPYKKSNNIKKKENSKDKMNEQKEKDRLIDFSKEQYERKMPYETPRIKEREREQHLKYLSNPYTQGRKKEENNKINHQINDNRNKKKEINYNNFTEKESSERNKPKKIMENPYKKQQNHQNNTEQIKNNNDKNDNIYFNETPNAYSSQKYENLKNPYGKEMKADDKRLANDTPGNQPSNDIKNYKTMVNPYRNRNNINQNQRNPFKKDSESNQNNINEQKNEIKEEKGNKEKSNITGNQFSQILKMINKKSI